MNIRKDKLIELREILNMPEDYTEKSDLINFQNSTLRPLLKFQNVFLVQIFRSYIDDRKFNWSKSDRPMKKKFINNALSTDINLKFLCIGSIISLLTQEELKIYLENKKEINKRIIAMAKERLIDQIINKQYV